MSVWFLGLLLVVATAIAAIAGLIVVRRAVPYEALREHHDVAGFIIAIVGVIYAVLLALIALSVWEDFRDAKETVALEANGLADLYRISDQYPPSVRERIRSEIRVYAEAVVSDEWPRMARRESSNLAIAAMDRMWISAARWKPSSSTEEAAYGSGMDALRTLSDNRRMRILTSREGVPALMWAVLHFGGIVTVVFTYFFGLRNARVQVLMTALLAAEIALVLFLISALNHPFSGDLRVEPEPFENVLARFEQIDRHEREWKTSP